MIRRGDIYLVSLDPAAGSEQGKVRPAVIVSNNAANQVADRLKTGVVTVVPLTSNVTSVYPFHLVLAAGETGLRADSKAQAEQIRAVSPHRLVRPVGRVAPEKMYALDEVLRLHLSL